MLRIRPAAQKDAKEIVALLRELDLYYASLALEGFWVAEEAGKIAGTVQLAEHPDFYFLGSLGVSPKNQGKGIGSSLMRHVLKDVRKNVYLYTVIPEYFRKFGFEITPSIPGLPSKDRYECEYCHPERCVTMVKSSRRRTKHAS